MASRHRLDASLVGPAVLAVVSVGADRVVPGHDPAVFDR